MITFFPFCFILFVFFLNGNEKWYVDYIIIDDYIQQNVLWDTASPSHSTISIN